MKKLIFKQGFRKKGLPRCYRFWKYLTMLATSTTDKKPSLQKIFHSCAKKSSFDGTFS